MLSVVEHMSSRGHEQVVFCNDKDTGLKAIIAIHNTTLGPALGGCRMWEYKTEEEALKDVLRLSRGMSYKAAIAGLNLGGGKAVIIGDSKKHKNEIVTGYTNINSKNMFKSLHDPKVVFSDDKNLLYASRSPIPANKRGKFNFAYRQVCIYAFPKKNISHDSHLTLTSGNLNQEILNYYPTI